MGLKDMAKQWVDKKKEERAQKKEEEEELKEEHAKEFDTIESMLDKFDMGNLKDFCKNYLGTLPKSEKGEEIKQPDRETFVFFICELFEKGKLNLEQIKDYSLKRKIVSQSFFASDSTGVGNQNEFDVIMSAIRDEFQPEKISDEYDLETQLKIFLETKFPGKRIERQFTLPSGDRADLRFDEKYVFELKVPSSKNQLRSLSAQLEEYSEHCPFLCAVIADVSKVPNSTMVIEPQLTQTIKEYVDRYKTKNIPSVVMNVRRRGQH